MKIFVKPAPGLIVLGPDGLLVPEDGMEVEQDSFWLRRLADGDLVRVFRPAGGGE